MSCLDFSDLALNISKPQQRTLHALAQGGVIVLERNDRGGVIAAECLTRDGWALSDCDLAVFKSLKARRMIASQGGQPYRITREGLVNLRAQLDNRVSSKRW
jgi:uncharacterized protein YjhX (UPF0386 family)